jgi:hypothetical protein
MPGPQRKLLLFVNRPDAEPIVERMPRLAPTPRQRSVVFVAALSMMVACGNGPTVSTGTDALPGASTVTATPPRDIPSARGCDNPSPTSQQQHGLEIEGTMRGGEPFYALFEGVTELRADEELTTYLRMPGARVLRMTLVAPDDRLVRVGGPRPGLAPFRWERPGDPWVGTLTFSRGGCWRIYVDRSGVDGEIWVLVR